jgi:ABC transporter DrrB family efflux protein
VQQKLQEADLVSEIHDEPACRQRLRTGETDLFIEVTPQGVRYVYDRARPESLLARGQADAAMIRWKADLKIQRSENSTGETVTQLQTPQGEKSWTTCDAPVSRYIDFLMPGLMGLNIMGGGLFGVGFVLVDMRVRKLLKRLLATPMRRSDFLLSILGGRLVMLLPEMTCLWLAAWLVFGVPQRGNPLTLILVIVMGGVAFAGLGLVLASRTEKTETISGLLNLVMLPSYLLCGTFFSSRRFPEAVQYFIQALPLTQLNDALREVMLEGSSLAQVSGRLAILAAWGGISFLLALKWFRWQ